MSKSDNLARLLAQAEVFEKITKRYAQALESVPQAAIPPTPAASSTGKPPAKPSAAPISSPAPKPGITAPQPHGDSNTLTGAINMGLGGVWTTNQQSMALNKRETPEGPKTFVQVRLYRNSKVQKNLYLGTKAKINAALIPIVQKFYPGAAVEVLLDYPPDAIKLMDSDILAK